MRTVAVLDGDHSDGMFSLTDQLVADRRHRLNEQSAGGFFRRRRNAATELRLVAAPTPSVERHLRPVLAQPVRRRLTAVRNVEAPVRLLVDEAVVEARHAVGQ
jgi:hypothetical protein